MIIFIDSRPLISSSPRGIGVYLNKIIDYIGEYDRENEYIFMDDGIYPYENFAEAHYNSKIDNDNTFYCGQIRFSNEKAKVNNYYHFRDEQHLSNKDVDINLKFNQIVVMDLLFRKNFLNKICFVNEGSLG